MADPAPSNFITRLMRGEVQQHAIGATLGCRLLALDLAAGTLEAEYLGTDALVNPAGQVQGGILGAMLDDITASLVTATGSDDERCATLDLHLSFLRPVSTGTIHAQARMVRRGRDICTVSGELTQGGKQVAIATATCMVVRSTRP